MQYTYWDIFSTAQNSFWTHQFWCLLEFLLLFISPLPHQQNVSLWRIFHPKKQKKIAQGEIGWIGRWGMGVIRFLVKNWTISKVWPGEPLSHPSWHGQMRWKSLQKKFHWRRMQPLTIIPAGTPIQVGPWNTQLAGDASTTRVLASRGWFQAFLGPPL